MESVCKSPLAIGSFTKNKGRDLIISTSRKILAVSLSIYIYMHIYIYIYIYIYICIYKYICVYIYIMHTSSGSLLLGLGEKDLDILHLIIVSACFLNKIF